MIAEERNLIFPSAKRRIKLCCENLKQRIVVNDDGNARQTIHHNMFSMHCPTMCGFFHQHTTTIVGCIGMCMYEDLEDVVVESVLWKMVS